MYSIIITIVAIFFLVQYIRAKTRNYRLILDRDCQLSEATTKYNVLKDSYGRMEQGSFELAESYEMDMLDLKEKLSERDAIIENHAAKCHGLVEHTIEMLLEKFKPIHEHIEVHNHPKSDPCGAHGCTADRYVDGTHVFSDTTIKTAPVEGYIKG